MAVTVHLPKVGMTMEEGTLVRWLVPDGAAVRRGEPIFEMETEKVEMEVEADGEGVLKHLAEEGMTLAPGAIVGAILAEGETEVPAEIRERFAAQPAPGTEGAAALAEAAAEAAPPERAAAPEGAAAPPRPGRVAASPVARRLAREHGIELNAITGSGPNGRIVERDVQAYIERGAPEAEPAPAADIVSTGDGAAETIAYAGRRRTIGERMHQSLQGMAQLTLSSEVRVDDAMRMLHGLNREWRRERVAASFTALVVRSCALALREHPRLNSRLEGERIVVEPAVNVGFAVSLEDGLIVPVVREADRKRLQEVARAIADLTERAREGKLAVDEVTGGSFTVTSLDGLAVDAFTPVINPPQCAILGVGRVRQAPVVSDGRLEAGQVTTLSLTFDHRVVDGEPAGRFLTRAGELLGRPYLLM